MSEPEPRTGSAGRARGVTRARVAFERAQEMVWGNGWAARLAHALGAQGEVVVRATTMACPGFTGPRALRIAFASDLHAGPTTHPDLIHAACAALAAMRADVMLLGGDFVSLHARHVEQIAPLLAAIPAPLGKFAVLGNHDLWADHAHIVRCLEAAGIAVLTNRNARLPAPFADVWICGLDEALYGAPDADRALAGADGLRLVLMHSPDGLLALGDRRFDAAFCGHTHGGQITLPGGDPIVVPQGELSRRYAHGVHAVGPGGTATLLVSRGVGCTTVPIRLGARPEVHLVTMEIRE